MMIEKWLPLLILLSFPLLYWGGNRDQNWLAVTGLFLLFTGISGTIIKRIYATRNKVNSCCK